MRLHFTLFFIVVFCLYTPSTQAGFWVWSSGDMPVSLVTRVLHRLADTPVGQARPDGNAKDRRQHARNPGPKHTNSTAQTHCYCNR